MEGLRRKEYFKSSQKVELKDVYFGAASFEIHSFSKSFLKNPCTIDHPTLLNSTKARLIMNIFKYILRSSYFLLVGYYG